MTEITWTENGMSNFDHTVDPGMAEDLGAGMRGCHNGWNMGAGAVSDLAADPDAVIADLNARMLASLLILPMQERKWWTT